MKHSKQEILKALSILTCLCVEQLCWIGRHSVVIFGRPTSVEVCLDSNRVIIPLIKDSLGISCTIHHVHDV